MAGIIGALRLLFLIFFVSLINIVGASVVAMTKDNVDQILTGTEVVFVNFYADWCRFSQMLTPVFAEASEKFNAEPPSKVIWASVDCDRNPDVAQRFSISKYPTLKMFRNGQVAKREYRGQRSVESLAEHVRSQLQTSVIDVKSVDELNTKIDNNKRKVVAFFAQKSGPAFDNVQKVSSNLRDDCQFLFGEGQGFEEQTRNGPHIYFRDKNAGANDVATFTGDATNYEYISQWITDKCIPLVREITFENAEELTEEGVPFLILFKTPEDTNSLEIFTQEVARQLSDMKSTINCLYADGRKFAHPLHHLGKAEKDLPIIAIDSFRHMYLFPSMNEITVAGKLRQFIVDLNSGKLHREFHHGPDATETPQQQINNNDPSQANQPPGTETDPPPSVFQKLKPSHNRYTLLERDEL